MIVVVKFMFKLHLLLIKEFKYFLDFNFIAICTYIFNVELSMFEWQPKKCKCERTFDLDYIPTDYKIKILYEYESFNITIANSIFTTPPSLPFNNRLR